MSIPIHAEAYIGSSNHEPWNSDRKDITVHVTIGAQTYTMPTVTLDAGDFFLSDEAGRARAIVKLGRQIITWMQQIVPEEHHSDVVPKIETAFLGGLKQAEPKVHDILVALINKYTPPKQ